MNTVETVWLKRYCNTTLSNYLSQNSYEITKLLKDIGLLTKGDKFSIENSVLDQIFKIFSNTNDTDLKFKCIYILFSEKYRSKERLSLAFDFLLMNTEISNTEVFVCISTFRSHFQFFKTNFRKETHLIYKRLSENLKKEIIDFNIDKIETIKGIIRYLPFNLINLDNRSSNSARFAEFKHKIELKFQQIDEQMNDCSDLIQKTYYGLKCISALIDSNQNLNDQALMDTIELTVNFLDLLFKKKLILENYLAHNQIIELMNIFYLFNKLNINNFQTDNIKKTLLKLKDLNKIWYEHNRGQIQFSESSLILYNFAQMSLNIQNETLIMDMFEKIRSLDNLKEKCINTDQVFYFI
jgi:hypothetical protein